MKQDILSLFSSAPAASASVPTPSQGLWGQPAPVAAPSVWGQPVSAMPASTWGQPIQAAQPAQSMMGTGGPAMWGADSWGSPAAAAPPTMSTANIWGSTQTQYNTSIASQDIWASATPAQPAAQHQTTAKQDDAFDDLWGGFK